MTLLGVLLLFSVVPALFYWARRSGFSHPNVLLITLDTTRADHLSCYGYEYRTSPTVDQIAAEGTLFLNAQAPCAETLPAHTSLMTGLYPLHHGARYNGAQQVCDEVNTLAEVLAARGYGTGAFVSAFVLDPMFHLDQGFQVYNAQYTVTRNPYFARPSERRAEETVTAFLRWLEARPRGPFFAWIHLFDPHQAYDPPQAYKNLFNGPNGKYDGEIAYADSQVARVLRVLREKGLLSRTLVVLAADHGEGLSEHGEISHSFFAYQSTLRIPLILRGPGIPAGRQIEALVRSVDLFPTILDCLGLDVPGGLDGMSLKELMRGRGPGPAAAFSEALAANAEFGWPPLYALTDGRFSYILHKNPELYRMDIDQAQNHDLARDFPDEAERRRNRILDFLRQARPLCSSRTTHLAEGQMDLIAGLGYMGGGRGGSLAGDFKPEVDFKAQAGFVDEAIKLRSIVNFDGSPARLRDVVKGFLDMEKKYPAMPFIVRGLADAYSGLRQFKQAEAAYLRLVELEPGAWEPRRSLASFYDRMGWADKAVAQFRLVVKEAPEDEGAWNSLGANLMKTGDLRGAREAFLRSLQLNPDFGPARANLRALDLGPRRGGPG